jgi:hypothetical protein
MFPSGLRRRSKLMEFIGNPRHSTFRRLSATDTTFQIAQIPEHMLPPSARDRTPTLSPYPHPTIPVQSGPKERVIVNYHDGKDQAPTLEITRFSAFNLLSPSQIIGSVEQRTPSTPNGSFRTNPSYFAPRMSPSPVEASTSQGSSSPSSSAAHHGHQSLVSNQSLRPESLRELAFQFPSLPSDATDIRRSSMMARYHGQDIYSPKRLSRKQTTSSNSSNSSSSAATVTKRRPRPFTPASSVLAYNEDNSSSRNTFGRNSSRSNHPSKPSLESDRTFTLSDRPPRRKTREVKTNNNSPTAYSSFESNTDPLPSAPRSARSQKSQRSQSPGGMSQVVISNPERVWRGDTAIRSETPYSPAITEASWMDREYIDEARLEAVLKVNIGKGNISRIGTVGKAPRRNTPTPLHIGGSDRKSMAADGFVMTSQHLGAEAQDMSPRRRKFYYGVKGVIAD